MNKSDFVGAWIIADVAGEVVWPFQVGSELNISPGEARSRLLVVVSAPNGGWRGTFDALLDESEESATIERVEYEGSVNRLVMRVEQAGPTARRVLVGSWSSVERPETKGTWTGNAGGGSEEDRGLCLVGTTA